MNDNVIGPIPKHIWYTLRQLKESAKTYVGFNEDHRYDDAIHTDEALYKSLLMKIVKGST